MNNSICAAPALLSRLPAELRDEVFVRAPTVADAHRLNTALDEGRDASVWRQLTRAHLPEVLPLLAPEAQNTLATHVEASAEHRYGDCEAVWGQMDIASLTEAAATLAQTEEAQALKPVLVREVLQRFNQQFESRLSQDDLSPAELSMLMLHQNLDNTLFEGARDAKLELCLDAGIGKLPDILAGFDHVEHLVLRRMPDAVDLSVTSRMRGLKTITLHYGSDAALGLPRGLDNKIIEVVRPQRCA